MLSVQSDGEHVQESSSLDQAGLLSGCTTTSVGSPDQRRSHPLRVEGAQLIC